MTNRNAIVLNTAMDAYLERLRRELEDATGGAASSDLAQGPPGKWTAAEVLEHLYLTYLNTNKGLAKCKEKGAPLGSKSTLRNTVRSFVVVNLGYFPEGRQAPERAVPKGIPVEDVRRGIIDEIQKMDASFAECEGQFGRGAKLLDHPALGPLTARQWRKFHWVHGRHHAKQMRERRGSVGGSDLSG